MKLLPLLAAAAGLALPLATPVAAHAQRAIDLHARNAGELAELCAANPREAGGDARINYCHGFAQGVVDLDLEHSKAFCFPKPSPTRTETLHQFVEWVHESSDHRSLKAADGLIQFLAQRYPCH